MEDSTIRARHAMNFQYHENRASTGKMVKVL